MKQITLTLTLFLFVSIALSQKSYNGIPVMNSKSNKADYKIGNDWMRAAWTISPQIESDSLFIYCYTEVEEFAFYTDLDSIKFNLTSGQIRSFYVSLNDSTKALTVVKGVKLNEVDLSFDNSLKNSELEFVYEQNENNEYLNLLRSKYPIDSLAQSAKSDTERALKILNWVHNRWAHNGNNVPRKSDAISILEEVKEGKNFRCVEYGIVATACLNAVSLKARTLALKTKDVETRPYGAGHVLLEVFLNDINKWVLLDGQWDVMPALNGVPLNAVEFQKAISDRFEDLEIKSLSSVSKRQYCKWVYPYLYYFDIAFDNREGQLADFKLVNGKRKLMLVPLMAKEPSIFQKTGKIQNCLYTNSYNDFYSKPN